jgi:hypothetical protein
MSDAPLVPEDYLGLDLNNKDSMREAVKIWADLRDGKLIRKEQAESEKLIAIRDAQEQSDQTIKQLETLLRQKLNLKIDDTREAIFREIDHLMVIEDSSKKNVELLQEVDTLKSDLTACRQSSGEKTSVNLSEFASKPFLMWVSSFLITIIGVLTNQIDYTAAVAGVTASSSIYGVAASAVKRKEIDRKIEYQKLNQSN